VIHRTRLLLAPFIFAALPGCGSPTDGGDGGADLAGADLAGADLAGRDLARPTVDLAGADLADAGVDLATALPDLAGQDLAFGGKAQPATQATGRYFPDTAPWYRDVTNAPTAADSGAITAWMVQHAPPNGWGLGKMQIDFSIAAVDVPAGTTKLTYATDNNFYSSPDCDTAPIPVVPGGAVEGSLGIFTSPFSGYACPDFAGGGDCHMLFVARGEKRLYEVYHATIDAQANFTTGCLAIWDATDVQNPPPNGRGQQCTSADAAGFPMAPLLFTVEEVQAGVIDHAVRFILPNDMIRMKKYVAPATHGTNTTGPATSGPYGFQMRLHASYPINTLSAPAQVVAKALQKYGMYLADGGNVALTAQSDLLSSVTWAQVGLDSHALGALKATDFDVIDYGTPIDVTYNCTRTPITQ
jgi:serine/threonine-protein kinase